MSQTVLLRNLQPFRRAAFKFGRRLHFALRRNMLNHRLLAFQRFYWTLWIAQVERWTALMKQMSREIRRGPNWFQLNVNSKREWRKWPLKFISACFLMLFYLACNSVPENWHICVNKGLPYLLLTNRMHLPRRGLIASTYIFCAKDVASLHGLSTIITDGYGPALTPSKMCDKFFTSMLMFWRGLMLLYVSTGRVSYLARRSILR